MFYALRRPGFGDDATRAQKKEDLVLLRVHMSLYETRCMYGSKRNASPSDSASSNLAACSHTNRPQQSKSTFLRACMDPGCYDGRLPGYDLHTRRYRRCIGIMAGLTISYVYGTEIFSGPTWYRIRFSECYPFKTNFSRHGNAFSAPALSL